MITGYFLLVFLLGMQGGPIDYRVFPVSDKASCEILHAEMSTLLNNNASTRGVVLHCIEVNVSTNPKGHL